MAESKFFVEDKLLQKKINFIPHPAQKRILDNMTRFTNICAGRRFGKSKFCAYLALREIIYPGKKIWIVAPTYDLSQKVFNYITEWISKYFPSSFKIQRSPYSRIENLATGSILEGKSAENKEGLMGEELDLVIIDEASAMNPEVWETFLFPSLANRKGSAVLISTPKGKNWFYKIYMIGKNNEFPAYSSFHFSSKDSPVFPQDEWEAAKKVLPKAIFQQEYEALFRSDAAAVFRGIEDCIWGELEEPDPTHLYITGVDLGKYLDFTVITVIDRNTNKVVAFDRFQKIGWPLQRKRIIEIVKKYNNGIVVVDSTGKGDPVSDELANEGLSVHDFKYTNTSKDQLITKTSIFIEQKKIRYPAIPELLNELEIFGYQITKSGNIKYSAPEGAHDDCVNSLALAIWELDDQPLGNLSNEAEVLSFPINNY